MWLICNKWYGQDCITLHYPFNTGQLFRQPVVFLHIPCFVKCSSRIYIYRVLVGKEVRWLSLALEKTIFTHNSNVNPKSGIFVKNVSCSYLSIFVPCMRFQFYVFYLTKIKFSSFRMNGIYMEHIRFIWILKMMEMQIWFFWKTVMQWVMWNMT